MPVRILDEAVINKIAAGEVVERPASVVKELLENALDAGATSVDIVLSAGGRNLVRVIDDGAGMDRTDAMMCLERHATSKIRTDEDLFRVASLGFRGEAIPSIAAVSRFEILTRPHDADSGTRIVVDGGKLTAVEPAGAAPGTQVSAGSLFFNLPARRKFLRSVETELGHCVEAVIRELLLRVDVRASVRHDEREALSCAAGDARPRRAAGLLGPHGEALVPADFARGNLEVRALVSPVGVHRGTATASSYLYVNGRYVKDAVLRRAVNEAYAGIVPKDRYPLVVMDVRIPPADVDVNVHPAKTEVRFQHAFELQRAVAAGLREALQGHGIQRPVASEPRYRPPEVIYEQPRLPVVTTVDDAPRREWVPAPQRAIVASASTSASPVPPVEAPAARPSPRETTSRRMLLPVDRFSDLRILGQLDRTYILCDGAGSLVIVDQHAAAERITLQKLLRAPELSLGGGQRRLVPAMVALGPSRARALAPHLDALARHGLEVADMGGGSFAVQTCPAALADADLAALLGDVADELADGARPGAGLRALDGVLERMACHTSIRAGQVLDHRAMSGLLAELDDVEFSVCAHGRPVAILVEPAELEKRFHRA